MDGFTKKYGIHLLVYYEFHDQMSSAIEREKQMKKWNGSGNSSLSRSTMRIGKIYLLKSNDKCLGSRFRGNDGTAVHSRTK